MKRKIYNHGFYDYYYKCQECGCEKISLKHLGGFQHADLICDNCGCNVTNNKIQIDKYICLNCKEIVLNPLKQCPHCGYSSFGKTHPSNKVTQPQVDFEMLKALEEQFDNLSKGIPLLEPLFKNGKLFFHLLSTKPTFAKVAYEELNKLNK